MAIRKYNPTTPGLRGMTVSTFEEITCDDTGKVPYRNSEKTRGKKLPEVRSR